LHIGHFQTGSLQPTTVFQEGVRRDTRLEVGLRVRSHQFCGYAAITNDLSENGMQLTLREPVQVATNLDLALDFEDESESLEMAGVVRWCQVSAPHRVGIQFVNLTAEQQAVLRNFMQDRTEPQLPGLPDDSEPDEEATSENALRAEVIDAYRQGEIVAIRLKKGEEVLEYRYALPEVDVSDLKLGASIGQIVTEPTEDGLFRYSYIDSSGELVLEVIAAPPEVTVSAA
jgi:Tfp pilus assembly protein PilZ